MSPLHDVVDASQMCLERHTGQQLIMLGIGEKGELHGRRHCDKQASIHTHT